MSLTYGSLQVLPWNNDTTIKKMNSCNWCRQITDFFKYIHSWNQGGIIFINMISRRYNPCSAKKQYIWKKNACLQLFFCNRKRVICRMGSSDRNFDLTQYFSNMWEIHRITYAIHGCKCSSKLHFHEIKKYCNLKKFVPCDSTQ